jgi:hypothetical protein
MPTDLNFPFDVITMIADLPAGLDRAILGVLAAHVGRQNIISRKRLLDRLAPDLLKQGVRPTRQDRSVRLAINQLRKKGYPICSTGGIKGGYFLAASRQELEDYLAIEIHARAMDLLEQERLMRSHGDRIWPTQAALF